MDAYLDPNIHKVQIWGSHDGEDAVFWVVAPCSVVGFTDVSEELYSLHHQGDDRGDEGSKLLGNVGQYIPDYTMLRPRRQPPSYSSPWELQISLKKNFIKCLWIEHVASEDDLEPGVNVKNC
jgi:hypothetical protein